jgi:hypothetical protein
VRKTSKEIGGRPFWFPAKNFIASAKSADRRPWWISLARIRKNLAEIIKRMRSAANTFKPSITNGDDPSRKSQARMLRLLRWLTISRSAKMDLDRGSSRPADLEQVDCIRTRRLAADLFNVLRPTLAIHPHRENAYIALDAVAWTAAIILADIEDRDALDFFTVALTQNLADLGNPNPPQTIPTSATDPEVTETDEPER